MPSQLHCIQYYASSTPNNPSPLRIVGGAFLYPSASLSEYYSTFKEPLGIIEVNEDKVLLRYYKNQKIRPKNDIITSVSTNYTKELNGEIYFRNTSELDSITVTLIIHDYEKATHLSCS